MCLMIKIFPNQSQDKKARSAKECRKGQLHATCDQIISLMALLVYQGPALYLLSTKKPSTP